MRNPGALLCLASGAAFGAMAIFGKLAYQEGATVGTLLAVRFALAALLFWALVARSGGLRRLRTISRRDIALALALGAVGYSAQAGAYFAALRRMDASLLSLLLYTFPAIVTVAAIALGRERFRPRTTAALALASLGLVLVLALPGTGALDPVGTALAISAAVIYSTYLLVSEGVVSRVGPLTLSALVCTGATATLTVAGVADGDLDLSAVSPAGYGWLAAIAVISTVAAVGLLFAGIRARWSHLGVDPLDHGAGGHGSARVPRLRRVAGRGSAARRGARARRRGGADRERPPVASARRRDVERRRAGRAVGTRPQIPHAAGTLTVEDAIGVPAAVVAFAEAVTPGWHAR